jgi:hypothetical protein
MDTEEKTQSRAALDLAGRPQQADWRADPVAARLEVIVSRSRRRGRARRALSHIGNRFAQWLDNLVPPAPANDSASPPELRFPFF